MSELSPQAQAVLYAAHNAPDGRDSHRMSAAAALRAAANQPCDIPVWIIGDAYWNYRNGVDAERERLLAIATELENHQ